ncbi:SICAvar, type I (fragment) [Plasmodium knowlesi strain H]|uniref:SICAvar, type I n=4 Tax=Plasmodium knowlesi TaxID=5850 RepID=A0A1A7VU55_PLAKH
MRCVLLNAIADKLQDQKFPCTDEKKVADAITKAFEKSGTIKSEGVGCKTNDKCFECKRVPLNDLNGCNLDSKSTDQNVKTKVEKVLNEEGGQGKKEMDQIWDQAIKDICKPCTRNNGDSLCDQLKCIGTKWKSNRGYHNYNNIKNDFKTHLTHLLTYMKDTDHQSKVATYCDEDTNGHTWSVGDAAGEANKTACKLVAAGLQRISTIQQSYSKRDDNNPYDNQEFKQFTFCLMLKAVVQKMKEQSPICDIQPGITKAFSVVDKIKSEHCKNDKPCILCNWSDGDYDELKECRIDKDNDKVKDKLDSLLKVADNEVRGALKAIADTPGNKGPSLCNRLQCLSSKVEALKSQPSMESAAENFWKDEVKDLWKDLSAAMTKTNGKDTNGGQCAKVDGERDATHSEQTACNYLHAGLTELYKTNGSTPTATPSAANGKLLDNPLLRQTVGCLLLHAYAKKMKSEAKCLVESGIKKAFGTAPKDFNKECENGSSCIECKWDENIFKTCTITTKNTPEGVEKKLTEVQSKINNTSTYTLKDINITASLCDKIKCAASNWFRRQKEASAANGGTTKTWCQFWDEGVKVELQKLFQDISSKGTNGTIYCKYFGDGNADSVERKACNHIAAGLKYIKDINSSGNDQLFKRIVGCIALNMYADEIIKRSQDKCPIDKKRIEQMFKYWNLFNNNNSCSSGDNNCFKCERNENFKDCELSVSNTLFNPQPNGNCDNGATNVKTKMEGLLLNNEHNPSKSIPQVKSTLTTITNMDTFCSKMQCAAKQYYKSNNKNAKPLSWSDIDSDAKDELKELLEYMIKPDNQSAAAQYCKDNENKWNAMGHKEGKTNKAACLLFASGLKHIYTHGIVQKNGQVKDHVKGPSFEQTMGCLFLKEYAKQLKEMAKKQKKYRVHPNCSVDSGIDHAFEKSKVIMQASPQCKKNVNNDCFECDLNKGYDKCSIGDDDVGNKAKDLFEGESEQNHMQQTLENTVCPILLTDILTPFLPLAPVSIGLSAMAYYLWKYFGPLGKGGARLRRSPAEIPGPSVQEQVYDHVQQDSSHEYQLVKERKPRSVPTRTKRSGRVNRRTIIEIHFEVLDECQKGDTQLNQKDFLELLVQEFMGSEFMEEEEQVPKEELFMEGVSMESVPIKEVPSLGSGLMV